VSEKRRSLLESTLALPSTDFFMKQSIDVNVVVRPTSASMLHNKSDEQYYGKLEPNQSQPRKPAARLDG
jgi:hypothetical protein